MRVPEDVEWVKDVEYGVGGERKLLLDIVRPKHPPAGPMPVLVWVHGGAWLGGDKSSGIWRLAPYAQKGYFCATISYRLSQVAVFPAQIEDCKCAIRYLRAHARKYNIDADRIGVWGSSAGGHLVAMLGTAAEAKDLEGTGGWKAQPSKVQAVCDWCGPSDLLAMPGAPSHIDRTRADAPEAKLIGGRLADNVEKARRVRRRRQARSADPHSAAAWAQGAQTPVASLLEPSTVPSLPP